MSVTSFKTRLYKYKNRPHISTEESICTQIVWIRGDLSVNVRDIILLPIVSLYEVTWHRFLLLQLNASISKLDFRMRLYLMPYTCIAKRTADVFKIKFLLSDIYLSISASWTYLNPDVMFLSLFTCKSPTQNVDFINHNTWTLKVTRIKHVIYTLYYCSLNVQRI